MFLIFLVSHKGRLSENLSNKALSGKEQWKQPLLKALKTLAKQAAKTSACGRKAIMVLKQNPHNDSFV